jgi:hypothetical protein
MFTNEMLENLFESSATINCSKIGIPVTFMIPECDGNITTLEGNQNYLGKNPSNGDIYHVLIMNANPYPVLINEFLKRYNVENNVATPISLPVKAVLAEDEGMLCTSWGSVLNIHPGNYILRYNKNDFAVIHNEVFRATYNIDCCSPLLLGDSHAESGRFNNKKHTYWNMTAPSRKRAFEKHQEKDSNPFKKRSINVSWAPVNILDSAEEHEIFNDLICATQYAMGPRVCCTPGIMVTEEDGVSKMHCTNCNQRVKRGFVFE